MATNTDDLTKKAEELFKTEHFNEVIELLTDKVLKNIKEADKAAALYVLRGNAWYSINAYNTANIDYDKAIDIDQDYALAFYNRGLSRAIQKEYPKALEDFNRAIEICPNNEDYYAGRGSILRFIKEYQLSIADYGNAIALNNKYASAYYNRGLAKNEGNIDLKGAKKDLERYLKLASDKNDPWSKYAMYYIDIIKQKIKDKKISGIIDLIDKIKDILLIRDDCVVHYTSISVVKSLIDDSDKFRISEGNFMNDPTEGRTFFDFLGYKAYPPYQNAFSSESFSAKPFIGSFVAKNKHDDLNMWRFYGKGDGAEANGCAITISSQEFIDDINEAISEREENYPWNDSDINFYKVVYLETGSGTFYIPGSSKNDEDVLRNLMVCLKNNVANYNVKNKSFLETQLNRIAFLFKNDVYKNENEVRIVVKGIGFKKEYYKNTTPSRVYIELESIKNIVKRITLGPKVEKINEWISFFYYIYDENPPTITISHLPYR